MKKEYLFFASGGGVYIDVYEVNQEETIGKIVGLVCALHKKTPSIIYEIRFHKDGRNGNRNEAFRKLTLAKEKKCQ